MHIIESVSNGSLIVDLKEVDWMAAEETTCN